MIDRNSWSADSQRRLLQKIQAAGIAFRDIDNGCPLNILTSALIDSITHNRLVGIEPPTFGFGSVQEFLDFASPVLGPLDRWIVPILASSVLDFFWRETWGARPLAETAHEVFGHLGNLPIKLPHQEVQDRLGDMVQLIRAASDDEPLILELRTDLDGRVYSVYGLDCWEIDLVEGDPDET